jgi:hypothetical protein
MVRTALTMPGPSSHRRSPARNTSLRNRPAPACRRATPRCTRATCPRRLSSSRRSPIRITWLSNSEVGIQCRRRLASRSSIRTKHRAGAFRGPRYTRVGGAGVCKELIPETSFNAFSPGGSFVPGGSRFLTKGVCRRCSVSSYGSLSCRVHAYSSPSLPFIKTLKLLCVNNEIISSMTFGDFGTREALADLLWLRIFKLGRGEVRRRDSAPAWCPRSVLLPSGVVRLMVDIYSCSRPKVSG